MLYVYNVQELKNFVNNAAYHLCSLKRWFFYLYPSEITYYQF